MKYFKTIESMIQTQNRTGILMLSPYIRNDIKETFVKGTNSMKSMDQLKKQIGGKVAMRAQRALLLK